MCCEPISFLKDAAVFSVTLNYLTQRRTAEERAGQRRGEQGIENKETTVRESGEEPRELTVELLGYKEKE